MFTDGDTFFFFVPAFPLFEFLVIYCFAFTQHVSCNLNVYLRLLCTFRSIIFFRTGFLSQNIGRSVIFNFF